MADYPQFMSDSVTEFSKGPKSIYVPSGISSRNIISGVVLNVPQTDEDDEWGRTERIAWESLIDKLSVLEREVESPYNPISGLNWKMDSLLTIIDLTVPSLQMGSINIDGLTNTITASTLNVNTGIFTGAVTAVGATITGTVTLSGAFNNTAILGSLTVAGSVTITGSTVINNTVTFGNTIATQDLYPNLGNTYNLGDSSVKYKNLYLSGSVNASAGIFSGSITADSLTLIGNISAVNLILSGSVTVDSLTVAGTAVTTIAGSTFQILSGNIIFNSGFVGITNALTCASSSLVTFNSSINTKAIYPISGFTTADIGTISLKYQNLYLSGSVNAATATFTGGISIGGDIIPISASCSLGSSVAPMNNLFVRTAIIPNSSDTCNLGSSTIGFKFLYMTDQTTYAIVRCRVLSGAWQIT